MYKCECGKEFENIQSIRGHKSHCKVHQMVKYGSLDNLNESIKRATSKSGQTKSKRAKERKEKELFLWIEEKHTCEKCGKVMTEKFGSGRFCSFSCANSRKFSEKTCSKISKSLKSKNASIKNKERLCEKCGNSFMPNNRARKLCYECQPQLIRVIDTKKHPTTILDLSKRTISKVLKRMDLPCSCCGAHVEGVVWDIHHIIPREQGGKDDMCNLTYICPNCHRIAHTDITKLEKELINLENYLESLNINWKDYYYSK